VPPEQAKHLEALALQMRREGASARLSTWMNRTTLVVEPDVPRPATGFRRSSTLEVFFDGDELRVKGRVDEDDEPTSGEGRPLSGVEELGRLVSRLRDRLLAEHAEEQKRVKIQSLKERAVKTQVAALAERMRFSYAFKAMATKMKLVVRLDPKVALYVDIPHKSAQPVIDKLEDLITVAREVYLSGGGARFKVTNIAGRWNDQELVFRSPGKP
jgi:hypothetical protein